MIELAMGANVVVSQTTLHAVLRWPAGGGGGSEVDLSALLLRDTGRVNSDADFVFYNQPAHPSGAVRFVNGTAEADTIEVELAAMPADISRIVIAASRAEGSFGAAPGAELVILEPARSSELVRFRVQGDRETAMLLGELYRRDGGWKFRAVGQGYESGLAGIATDFGITIDDSDQGAEPQASPDPTPQEARTQAPLVSPPVSVEASRVPEITDGWQAVTGGLFQRIDRGRPTPVISYVDRSADRRTQLAQLEAEATWIPEQVLGAVFEQIVGDEYRLPEPLPALTPGRVFAPTPAKIAVLLGPGDAESSHPLREQLWPRLDASEAPFLDAGETLIERHPITSASRMKPTYMEYGDQAQWYFTSQRIITTAKLHLPTSVRSDYKMGLGLVSPTLMEGFAAFKALSRRGQNRDRIWVQHVRFNWLIDVSCMETTTTKRKTTKTSRWYRGRMRYPNGKIVTIDLARFTDDDQSLGGAADRHATAFCQRLEDACRSAGLPWTQSDHTSRSIVGGTEAHTVWALDDNAGYSVDAVLLSAYEC